MSSVSRPESIDSPRYTVLFAAAVCVACALLVSVAAVSLKPIQDANARRYMEKNVLLAAGLVKPGQPLTDAEQQAIFDAGIRPRLVDLATGELVPEDRADARGYDQRKARNDPAQSRAAPPNDAGIGRLPNLGIVYFVMKDGQVDQLVIAIEGLGMWGTMYGFLSLAPDANTIRGLTYYDQKETPGLGGEIGNPSWQALWHGRRLYDAQGRVAITVIKGTAGPPESDPAHVDGMSGATVTSKAVSRLTRFWVSDQGYGRFLTRFRQRGLT